jgi:hypothetical protein
MDENLKRELKAEMTTMVQVEAKARMRTREET